MRIVAYYRVSTKRQGESGMGLDGQRSAVEEYTRRIDATLVASYTEVESGKRADRPELAEAIAHASRSKARLVVAKLDRLARNVAFLSALMESGADFVAIDNEHANRLTIQILAAVAEAEAKAISERTKAALAATRRRGTQLGSAREGHWDGREDRRRAGAKAGAARAAVVHRQAAEAGYADLLPTMVGFRTAGDSLRTIAAKLNDSGHTTRSGGPWNPMTVRNVLMKYRKGK